MEHKWLCGECKCGCKQYVKVNRMKEHFTVCANSSNTSENAVTQ